VRPTGDGTHYEIIAGERRWRAAQIAGIDEIPVIIRAEVTDSTALATALVENIQREDLNPIEEGSALKRLIDEFDMTHQQAADAVGRSRVSVTNLLRLLDLNEDVKALLAKGALEMGHARALLALDGAEQSEVAIQVADKGLSARETERLVAKAKAGDKHSSSTPATFDPDVRRLQTELSERLGADVRIQHRARGKGKLTIQYNSLDELDGILARIK
jgi:ParB family chromosome partitioning protein